jgi:hypothetical protein
MLAITKTPSKPRLKKRVRFSDPGTELSYNDIIGSPSSTGLTPMIKRSSLLEPSSKRRRTSAVSRRASAGDLPDQESTNNEVHTLSLSQTLNEPAKRLMRRSGLREEKNVIATEVEVEIQRLRAELADRDAEIERLHNETLVHDTGRIMELEQQIEALRTELAQRQTPSIEVDSEDEDEGDGPSRSFYDWTIAARDPFPDSYMDEDDDFRDMTMADVACSTPTRWKSVKPAPSRSLTSSFPTPPCTSPTMPGSPCSMRSRTVTPVTPQHSHVGIQAMLPDPEKEALEVEKEALEAELGSLRLELTKLTETLESHAALQSRLSEKLSSASSGREESSSQELEEHFDSVLETLSDRTAALLELNSSLSSLGFAGSDASEMIASIASEFRAARLELEYLTPGEITLPLSSHGAQVLNLVLTRLRDLSRKARVDEDAIDEYHALELSLRQQLAARVDAMENMRREQKKDASVLRERDDLIAELEVGLDRMKGAAEGYRRDIAELEALVQRLEKDRKVAGKQLQADLHTARGQLSERTAAVADLETKLASTVEQVDELQTKLKDLQRRKDAEVKVRNKSHGAALALRDARVMELRREIYGINESLRNAHEAILKLRVENAGLERKADKAEEDKLMAEEERRLAKEAVSTLKAELEKVTAAAVPRRRTRSSSLGIDGPTTPEPGSFLSAGLARSGAGTGKGRKRRKCDSGLGLLDEEDDVELVS